MFELVVEGAQTRLPVSSRAVSVGRGPTNDIVLPDDTVSSRHAALWADANGIMVQDLGSRNGTFINDVRVRGVSRAGIGDTVRFGENSRFKVNRGDLVPTREGLMLEDLGTGIKTSLPRDRLYLGDGPKADVRVVGAPEVVLFVEGPDELFLGIEDDTVAIARDEPFEVGSHKFAVRFVPGEVNATRDAGTSSYPYRLDVTLEGGPGPRAVISEPRTGARQVVTAENRATLLWILGRKRINDLQAGQSRDTAGWADESEVLTSVWGRTIGGTASNLRVLMCRLRKELKEGGFDPWFLEHRAGHLRVRLDDIDVNWNVQR